MAAISGRVLYDFDRSMTVNTGDRWLPNIPIVLQNTTSGLRITSSTDANGIFTFNDVPNGNYRVVEAYGEAAGPNIVSFTNATIGPAPTPKDPPISVVPTPPAGATHLDSLTPNTLLITVTGTNILALRFTDGPVTYQPIGNQLDSCTVVEPLDIITAADNGTMGTFPAGTATNTGAPGTATNPPYPGVTPGFRYVQPSKTTNNPFGGEYTIQNIMDGFVNTGAWWRMADHTTGDETGRLMVINGDTPGSIIFRQNIIVEPNSYYAFSAWAANLIKFTGFVPPIFKVSILDQSGTPIFEQQLTQSLPVNTVNPVWKQVGTAFSSLNNTSLTVVFTSEAPEQAGNDYAIDDIKMYKLNFRTFEPIKTVDKNFAIVGEVVTYTISIPNTCDNPLTNVVISDVVPNGVEFIPGSVIINNVSNPNANPNVGLNIGTVAGHSTTTITFRANVVLVPTVNPAPNTATMNYDYAPLLGGRSLSNSTNSNTVETLISLSALDSTKSVDKQYANVGDTLTYTLNFTNTSVNNLVNVVIKDVIPDGTTFVNNSITSTKAYTGTNIETGLTLIDPLAFGETVTITFRVSVDKIPNQNPIENQANVLYSLESDPTGPRFTTDTNIVNTTINNANLNSIKSVDKENAIVGDTLTYTLNFTNIGNVTATNVVIKDIIPAGTTFIDGSISSTRPYTGTNIETGITLNSPLSSGQSVTITFKVLVTSDVLI